MATAVRISTPRQLLLLRRRDLLPGAVLRHVRGAASAASAAAAAPAAPSHDGDDRQAAAPAADASQVTQPQMAGSRRDRLRKEARPFSDFLTDGFARQHDYLRISLTERCNLRCVYCMPEEGVALSPPRTQLTTPEVVLLSSLFVSQGVRKIRLTGGEPTVRADIVPLMRQIGALRRHGLRELCLTTNGVALHRKLEAMVDAGLTGVNLSLDTLDPHRFRLMTRRDGLAAVRRSLDRLVDLNRAGAGLRVKINCVVVRKLNDDELLDFVDLTRDTDVEVRFIEYMPFDGNRWAREKMVGYREMLARIRERYPTLREAPDLTRPSDTSRTYCIPGFAGRLGFITSMTHNFCGSCNRLRITSDGNLKVCLFGNAEVSLRDIIRKANAGEPIDDVALDTIRRSIPSAQQLEDGVVADEGSRLLPLEAVPNAEELLEVIGIAVKGKKARHAGLGELEHMKNRPMILIDTKHTRHFQSLSPWRPTSAVTPNKHHHHHHRASWPWTSNLSSPLIIPPPNQSATGHQARLFTTTTTTAPTRHRSKSANTTTTSTATATSTDTTVSSTGGVDKPATTPPASPRLTHLSASGAAHMIAIAHKAVTTRTATAACAVYFSSDEAVRLIRANALAKGDVLAVARVAGIMAAKRAADLIPLCHPLALSRVSIDLEPVGGGDGVGVGADEEVGTTTTAAEAAAAEAAAARVEVRATVECDGKTGVEMEALTAAAAAALTVYDMCKAVDRAIRIEGLRVVLKEGGKSGRWVEGVQQKEEQD